MNDELRDLARVVKAAAGMLLQFWKFRGDPPQHPYQAATRMIVRYLENRYGV